jgi:hypothetical protein
LELAEGYGRSDGRRQIKGADRRQLGEIEEEEGSGRDLDGSL